MHATTVDAVGRRRITTLLAGLHAVVLLLGLGWPTASAAARPVSDMITAAKSGDEAKVREIRSRLEAQAKPARGDRKTARALNDQALALLRSNNAGEAVELLTKAANADGGDVEILGNLGYALQMLNRHGEARPVLERSAELSPGRAATWGNLGEAYAHLGDPSTALAAFRITYLFSRNQEKTKEYLAMLIAKPDAPEALVAAATLAKSEPDLATAQQFVVRPSETPADQQRPAAQNPQTGYGALARKDPPISTPASSVPEAISRAQSPAPAPVYPDAESNRSHDAWAGRRKRRAMPENVDSTPDSTHAVESRSASAIAGQNATERGQPQSAIPYKPSAVAPGRAETFVSGGFLATQEEPIAASSSVRAIATRAGLGAKGLSQDAITTIAIGVLLAFLAMLFAGATNKLVIYFDVGDLVITFMPWVSGLAALIIAPMYQDPTMQVAVLLAGAAACVLFILWSFWLSILHNRSIPLGLVVGIFKVMAALLGTLLLAGSIAKFAKSEERGSAVVALMGLGIVAWLAHKLVNGERVYRARGWALPQAAG